MPVLNLRSKCSSHHVTSNILSLSQLFSIVPQYDTVLTPRRVDGWCCLSCIARSALPPFPSDLLFSLHRTVAQCPSLTTPARSPSQHRQRHSHLQRSASRPACRSKTPMRELAITVFILFPVRSPIPEPSTSKNSPSTWQIAGPYRLCAQLRASCPPSSCGARRGQRRPGSGCSYKHPRQPFDSLPNWRADAGKSPVGTELALTHVRPACFHANVILRADWRCLW
jgi:hypothetical protein